MWPVREVDEQAVAELAAATQTSPLLARLLWLRGVRDAATAHRWLNPSIEHLHPAELLPDFAAAVERLRVAISRRETILLWGHDDLDGITSIVILYRLLTGLQATVKYHIPTRGRERHGLDAATVMKQPGGAPGLVVTVDCGITNGDQVAELAGAGIDVVVTDHHEVPDPMPAAVANVDAKRADSKYPYRGLASAGVALKLGMGLVRQALGLSEREFLSVQPDLLAVTVLGTLADRVPLTGENRTLVKVGLRYLESTAIPAVRAIMEQMHRGEHLTVSRFVAELLPLFAAASGNEAVDKFLKADIDESRSWVADLARLSDDWRKEAERSFQIAQDAVRVGDGVLFVASRDLSLRALGSCAARLKDRYQVPAIVMGWRGEGWVGECRGVEGVSLVELLDACRAYLDDYGGHKKAAGFSIRDERVAAFTSCAEEYAHRHFAGRIQPENVIQADARLPLAEFDRGLAALAPFGDGNPPPVFLSDAVRMRSTDRGLVAEGQDELAFGLARREVAVEEGVPLFLLYSMDDRGQLLVLDAKPAQA